MLLDASGEAPPPFAQIYETYYPRICRYLARLLSPDEAEDVAQEVFLKASRSLAEFRGESSLSTWLYRIATNTATDRLRSPERRVRLHSGPIDVSLVSLTSVEHANLRREMTECVQEVVNQLPEQYRQALVLSEMEEWKDREIAEILGVTEAAVKIRLHRARARLRALLQARCTFGRSPSNIFVCDKK